MAVSLAVAVLLLYMASVELGSTAKDLGAVANKNATSSVYGSIAAAQLATASAAASSLYQAAASTAALSDRPVELSDLLAAASTLPASGAGHVSVSEDTPSIARLAISTTTGSTVNLCLALPSTANAPAPTPSPC